MKLYVVVAGLKGQTSDVIISLESDGTFDEYLAESILQNTAEELIRRCNLTVQKEQTK